MLEFGLISGLLAQLSSNTIFRSEKTSLGSLEDHFVFGWVGFLREKRVDGEMLLWRGFLISGNMLHISPDFKMDGMWFSILCWCGFVEIYNLELVLVKKGEEMEGSAGVTSARYQAQTSTSDDDLLVSSTFFICCYWNWSIQRTSVYRQEQDN